MNIPNIKDIVQKLSVFKSNMSLLVPVIISLVAGLLFIPTQLMSSKLKKQIQQESINRGNEINKLIAGAVSSDMWLRAAQQHQEEHAKDANEVVNLSRQSTQRELLSYDIFPEPDPNNFTPLVFQQFGGRFRSSIEDLVARFNGRSCPTMAELQRRLENSAAASRMGGRGRNSTGFSSRSSMDSSMGSMRMPTMGSSGRSALDYRGGSMEGSRGGGSMLFGNELGRIIIDEVCLGRAKSTSIYVDPVDLSGYEFWADYKYDVKKEDGVKDCWYYQLACWVIEDIFDTIGTMNSTYENVLTAPVKRLERAGFTTMGVMVSGRGGSMPGGRGYRTTRATEEGDKPKYLLSIKDGLAESCTGRFSKEGDGIDVIHFNVTVIVDVKAVLPFMQQLCSAKEHKFYGYPDGNEPPQTFKHNQITVLETKIISVNPEHWLHMYYRYGEDPVVELDLVCEYIFNRDGYEPIKPEPVKKTLRGEDEDKK